MSSSKKAYWDAFYANARSADVSQDASAFARWVEERLSPDAEIWEFGFGTARDARWFATMGRAVRGFDFAPSAVSTARRMAEEQRLDSRFEELDLTDAAQVARLIQQSRGLSGPIQLYGRFLLHAVTHEGRLGLITLASEVLPGCGGSLFLEFRTIHDAGAAHVFGDDHYREYLDPQQVADEIVAAGGSIVERVEGRGLAVYKSEDPHVARLVASWV